MSTHERLFITPDISHAINAMSGAVAECGMYPHSVDGDWRGWDAENEGDVRTNASNRQCRTCVRLVGGDW